MADQIIIHNLHDNQDHWNPSSPTSAGDLFEFFRGGLSDYSEETMMAHAEDIIFHGKLVPINQQLHRKQPPEQSENHHRRNQHHPLGRRRSRSESRSSSLVRNSRSLGYEKLKRNSSMWSEPPADITGDGSGKKSFSRRHVVLFGLMNVPPPEMDIRELKNRRVRLNKMPIGSWESVDVVPVSRSFDHRKCSWKVLEFLSCKSSSSAAVTTPFNYNAKV
ncbi:hypothetical protein L1987_27986 [Smallanthus sonchifolius]|uniref:Uncharacterized protein n=1 Tax=Smallanthus sonchifolius TaxID=185202 RepID=A0ACB9IC17_9ASTR|nr:hypothetical protein L1987_27986 [Smallanthus sonchifolius]